MKILCISDTHSLHRQIPLDWLSNEGNEIDTIIHAGDVSNTGTLQQIENFCEWYDSLNFTNKIFICGNHDWGFQKQPEAVAEIISRYPSITYLQDSSVIIDGVKIYGSPWQPFFFNWAFNLQRGNELKEKWDLIESDCHVLITHGPVHGLVDMTEGGEFVGCEELLDTINNRLDKMLVSACGHIHSAHGQTYKDNKLYINASTLNERYLVAYNPIIINIDTDLGNTDIIQY